MQIKKTKGNVERRILIGMVVDPVILGRISAKWERGLFKSKWANIVGDWCCAFYGKYGRPPMNEIESLYESWATDYKDTNVIDLVGKFLGGLSDEYENLQEESNSDYILDIAGAHFNKVKIEKLIDVLQGDLEDGDGEKANNRLTTYTNIEMGVGEGVHVLQDDEAIKEAFKDKKDPLIVYPGALGKFFDGQLERDGFIAFMGPEKRGKSFWLMDVAYRAMLQRRRVAMFEVGDMSQNQVMRRLMTRVARRPLGTKPVQYPINIERSAGDTIAMVNTKEKKWDVPLSWQAAKKACYEVMKKKIRSKHPYFRLSCHPNSSLGVKGIESIIQSWTRTDWVPDVIVIDYADILDMNYMGMEGRERINETWKQLRRLSQVYHCLVVTATQTDSASYKVGTMGKDNFSDDKRKLAHVTGMIGLNQSHEEKALGVMRLNWVGLREGEFSETRCVNVAGCLGIANPSIRSCF